MRNGLSKATRVWMEKSKNYFEERECPVCHKIFKCKPYEKKKYCSLRCGGHSEASILAGLKASELTKQRYQNTLPKKIQKIEEWVKNNTPLLSNIKMNNLNFLQDLCKYLGVKDQRSVAKILGLKGRKELVKKLIEISKNICCTGPN